MGCMHNSGIFQYVTVLGHDIILLLIQPKTGISTPKRGHSLDDSKSVTSRSPASSLTMNLIMDGFLAAFPPTTFTHPLHSAQTSNTKELDVLKKVLITVRVILHR